MWHSVVLPLNKAASGTRFTLVLECFLQCNVAFTWTSCGAFTNSSMFSVVQCISSWQRQRVFQSELKHMTVNFLHYNSQTNNEWTPTDSTKWFNIGLIALRHFNAERLHMNLQEKCFSFSSALDPVFTFFTETQKKKKKQQQTNVSFGTRCKTMWMREKGDIDDIERAPGSAHCAAHCQGLDFSAGLRVLRTI